MVLVPDSISLSTDEAPCPLVDHGTAGSRTRGAVAPKPALSALPACVPRTQKSPWSAPLGPWSGAL